MLITNSILAFNHLVPIDKQVKSSNVPVHCNHITTLALRQDVEMLTVNQLINNQRRVILNTDNENKPIL